MKAVFGPLAPRGGFSLVEVLVAVAIFSMLIIPVVAMFNQTSRAGVKTKEQMLAANLAQEKMEEYRSMGYKPLKGRLENLSNRVYYSVESGALAPAPGFSRSAIITFFYDPADYGLGSNPDIEAIKAAFMARGGPPERIKIKVEVKWKPRNSDTQNSYKLFTIVTKRKVFQLKELVP
ncbi:MAG: prepilin-type N-terminal cleavage/methylation domain-containing protein [bacterium]|jgi:prepilin-type N-terminal cleavage/methylation domain-containing protein|nr:prepilin-type N-terminal cleavage/methylation domain-containing protein [bacterium]